MKDIIVAVLSLVGTLGGAFSGVLVSNKLSAYRIEQLEKKLDKYANDKDEMKERLVIVEQSTKAAHNRIDDICKQISFNESRKDR